MSASIEQSQKAVSSIFEKFKRSRSLDEATEADTRCEIVDRVLEALGWDIPTVKREVYTGSGQWIDYTLRAREQAWLVVEAKRAGKTFLLDLSKHRSLNIKIPTLLRRHGPSIKEALSQAAGYCNDISAPFACVTNGLQWCLFRGLSSERRRWNQGNSIVFDGSHGPLGILENFNEFFSLLGYANTGSVALASRLTVASEGEILPALRPRDSIRIARLFADDEKLAAIREISQFLFSDLVTPEKKEMLNRCYVSPGTEAEFDSSIARLLVDSGIDSIEEGFDIHEGDPEDFKRQLDSLSSNLALRANFLTP